jgi:hypothetical protein
MIRITVGSGTAVVYPGRGLRYREQDGVVAADGDSTLVRAFPD